MADEKETTNPGETTEGTSPGTKQTVTTGQVQASGTGNTATSNDTVIQVPRPPRRDDGKWLGIGSIIGTLAGMLTNSDLIKKAKNAESDWEDLTKFFKDKGYALYDWGQTLKPCDDDLHAALCKFALCGYQTDYEGILRRARASAKVLASQAYAESLQTADRYHTGINCDVWAGIKRAEIISTVLATTQAYEQERLNAYDRTFEVLERTTQLFEAHLMSRTQLAADFLAGAGQNYGFLAQSLRATAKADMGDMQLLATSLAVVLPMLFNYCGSDACSDDDTGNAKE